MKESKIDFIEVMNYSEYLEYHLEKFERGKTLNGFSDGDLEALRDAVKNNFRGNILGSYKNSLFKRHILIPKEYINDYMTLKKLCAFFKVVPENKFIDKL
ncbi:hypothetical protein ACQ3MN_07720 [Enterococcus faecalis]|uniref:hypothetical protein n=1 Tax=Enterococcus faecalis TaxID=1351 RepID=UPI003D77235D